MQNQAIILPINPELKKVPAKQAPVKLLLPPADKSFLHSLAQIFVTKILQS
jgi:hypothetical protein